MTTYLIVCPLVFFAGLLDSIAGGGGLISLPAYLFAGIPPMNAVATNKLSSSCGTVIANIRYIKNKSVDFGLILPTVLTAVFGSSLGAQLVLRIDEVYIKYILVIALPIVAFLVLFKKNTFETVSTASISRPKQLIIAMIAAFIIGMYDGFYGPGTGTFLVLALTGIAKMDVKKATGNTKCINLASNLAALSTFLLHGKVLILLGIPAALFNIAGNYIGSGLVLKNGTKIVKPIILIVLVMLFGKVILEVF
ncbi:MAG: sulfite exporter TauE/SafE family protein [Lachnospiraceae bacterium]|nr:sulfite exporter TauE/SafE family protein [Lachnospiraceae bacterium]